MRISLGPCPFDWGRNALKDFYKKMAFETPIDILYIGEVVCSKRQSLTPEEMVELARALAPSGKEIVFSTLGLVMNAGEEDLLHRIAAAAATGDWWLEANDMGGIAVGEGRPMVAGPHITTYNPDTVAFLAKVGVRRVVFPVELSAQAMAALIRRQGEGMEAEVFAYGKLPLTFSARCYTARAFRFSKANCQFKCSDFPDGLTMRTQEGVPFLSINGTQTLSHRIYNLADETDHLERMGVKVVRLSPQSARMGEVIAVWHDRLRRRISDAEAWNRLLELNGGEPFCNGYFNGRPGLEWVEPGARPEKN
ncbi:MAG: U32 family peptidase [Magnetococcales bacterium]|nr:U32 family peptidase [Magnetococcales bacterium]